MTEISYDLLERLDLSLVAIGYARNIRSWKFSFEGHPFHRLYYVEKGMFLLKYPEEEFRLEAGSCCLIPAFYPFSYTPLEPNNHYYFHFNSGFLDHLPDFRLPLFAPPENGKRTFELFRELLRISWPGKMQYTEIPENEYYNLLYHSGVSELPLEIRMEFRCGLQRLLLPFLCEIEKNKTCFDRNIDVFSRIQKYIDEHIDRDIEVRELYELAGMRQAEFSSGFRRIFGIPPKQYICSRRVCRAMILLLETKLTVAEIARRTGYQDEYFFYRIFKKYKGISPGKWRENFLADIRL